MTAVDNTLDDDDEVISSINVIPFVDIALVLLIIFMLTSAIIARASFQVDLPRAASAGAAVDSTLNIVLDRQGQLFVNGELSSLDDLAVMVHRQASADPKLQAVIAADRVAQYGAVVDIIDVIKANGVSAFALNIERRPDREQE